MVMIRVFLLIAGLNFDHNNAAPSCENVMAHRVPVDDERLRGRRCGIDNCPSKRYYRLDGGIVCDRGHEQVLYTLQIVRLC